ncbi:MAG: type IV pilin protein [Azonexus sp.]|nr:type IV pilin protein [Azonexus sp.]
MSSFAYRMEQYFQDNRRYPTAAGGAVCGVANPAATTNFTFACVGLTDTSYRLTATGNGPMAGFVYTIDQAGTQRTTGVHAKWAAAVSTPQNCWVTSKSGC